MGNLEGKVQYGKFAIHVLRILYILCFLLGIMMFFSDAAVAGVAFVIVGTLTVTANIFIRRYVKKLQVPIDAQQNSRLSEIRENMQPDSSVEIDTSKIIFLQSDILRINKNCRVMAKKKLPYQQDMKLVPFDACVNIKSKEEIALQMVKDMCIAHKAAAQMSGVQGISDGDFFMTAMKFCAGTDAMNVIASISNGEFDQMQLTQLAYLYERVNVYMWVLGLDDKPKANKEAYAPMIEYQLNKFKNRDELTAACNMRSYEEIMEYADLITRYEWAMIELARTGVTSKHINIDSVVEQKQAMNFVTSFDADALLRIK